GNGPCHECRPLFRSARAESARSTDYSIVALGNAKLTQAYQPPMSAPPLLVARLSALRARRGPPARPGRRAAAGPNRLRPARARRSSSGRAETKRLQAEDAPAAPAG